MSTFVLIPGAASGPDHWHRVAPLLQAAGHDTVCPDLPCESDEAGLPEYTTATLDAIGDREHLVIVGQSLGAFVAAAVAAARPTQLLVYVNAMIPARGETPGAWWNNVGHAEAAAGTLRRHGPMRSWTAEDLESVFLHDVPPEAAAATITRKQGSGVFASPLDDWPAAVPAHVIAGRDDRLFPLAFQQRLARQRLGVEPDVLPGGHAVALANPSALAEQLLSYVDRAHVVVRRAAPDDAAGIEAVFNAAVREGWAFLGEVAREPMFGPEAWPELIAEHAPSRSLLVATDAAAQVIGYCAVHPEDGEMHLLFVHPTHAGRGVGRALLAAGHETLRAAGCTTAYLRTQEQNARALAFYVSAGYKPDGTVTESESKGIRIRELRLTMDLQG